MQKTIFFRNKTIRVIEINGEEWFSGQDFYSSVGITWKGSGALKDRNISSESFLLKSFLTNGGLQKMIFINKEAILSLTYSLNRLNLVERKSVLKFFDIKESDLKINRPEVNFINALKPILEGFGVEYYEQYNIGKYKIDCYVPLIGFIEYDEISGHKNLEADLKREIEIKSILNKDFFRCKQGQEKDFLSKITTYLTAMGIRILLKEIKKCIELNNEKRINELLSAY